ncbi:hypothetical protein LPJ59_000350 [Coemansia sp. RSA 2399]|nr:hypothetical protein LPJ59_000350 [Coemansia sp. RSA 2399]
MSAAARQVFEKYYAIGVADGYVYDIDFVNDLQKILEDGTIGIPELQDANVVSPIESKGESYTHVSALFAATKSADKIVIGPGEPSCAEQRGNSGSMALPSKHVDQVNQVAAATNAPIIVVMVEGRPRLLGDIPTIADAIIDAYLPGPYGSLPVAEILYGKTSRSGCFPITYPEM